MKKIISIFTMITLISVLIFARNSYAAALDTIDIKTNKTIVRPGEDVTVKIEFGQDLGAYTFNIDYDDAIFDYTSLEGGTANQIAADKVKVVYPDVLGATARNFVSITFRAKADITTSNPTEFLITAEGLANSDASVEFDDIITPIVKNVTVEPQYVDYTLKLEHIGEIVKNEEKPMTLSYSSPMGRYYEHARLIAESTQPSGATVQLLADDQSNLEHDIIQSGWGDAQGYKIGGKDVSQVLQTRAIFSQAGDYTITLKLIDRDNSDQEIAKQTFSFTVLETATPMIPEQTTPVTPEQEEVKPEETPKRLPKTGFNIYIPIAIFLMVLVSSYLYYNKKKINN